jgi:hypothetical protein
MKCVGAVMWRPGSVVDVVAVCDGNRGVMGYGRVNLPIGVGAKGGRLSKVARKIARSKALKNVARNALKIAARTQGAPARSALRIAQTAYDESQKLDRETVESPDDDLDESE